jgi:hypothetical protein
MEESVMSSTADELTGQLQAFQDHKAISDKLGIWCRCVDTRELGGMSEVFDERVEWDFGQGTVDHGLDAVIERIQAHIVEATYCGKRQIHIANLRVDVTRDVAESEAYFFSTSAGIREFEGKVLLEWGNYLDTWQRGTVGWRIVKRIYEMRIQHGPLEIVYGSAPAEMWQEGDHRRLDH